VTVAAHKLEAWRFIIPPETYLDPFVSAPADPGNPGQPGPGPGDPTPPNGGSPDTPIEQANLATALAGTMGDEDETEIKDSLNIDPVDRAGLAIMGVRVREVSRDALTGYVDGRAVYDDLQTPSLDGGHQQPIVSINRIHRGLLHRTLRHVDQALMNIVVDEEGEIAAVHSRDDDIIATLSRNWSEFTDVHGEHAAADFAQFVRDRDDEMARIFAALQELPSELVTMGLSDHEANEALTAVLIRLTAEIDGLDAERLDRVVRRSPWRPI